jgi:hypothetical protein
LRLDELELNVIASKKEKQIFIAVVSVIGAYVLYNVAESYYFDPMDQLASSIKTDKNKVDANDFVLAQQSHLSKVWADMQTHGLKSDETGAEAQLGSALDVWSSEAGLDGPADLRLDPPHNEGVFPVISYTVKVSGSTKSISKLLWALETATIPVRVTNLQINPQPEGSDSLQAHIEVSTLSMPPQLNGAKTPAPSTTQSAGAVAAGTSRPANVTAAVPASPVQSNNPTTQPASTVAPATSPSNSAGVTQ